MVTTLIISFFRKYKKVLQDFESIITLKQQLIFKLCKIFPQPWKHDLQIYRQQDLFAER
jgi:hypothetical protein